MTRKQAVLTLTPVLWLLAIPCAGCGYRTAALRLERSRLQLELSALKQLRTQLSDPAFPGDHHVAAVIGYAVLNQVLAGADGLETALPGVSGATLRVRSIRLEPGDGTPLLLVSALAAKGSLVAEVTGTAILVLDQPDGAPPVFRVRVVGIAPVLGVGRITFGESRLLNDIATVKADELALNRIAFPVPLEKAFSFDVPAVGLEQQMLTPRGNGSYVKYRVSRPAFAIPATLRINRVLFLRDGVHLFASLV